MHSRPPTLLPWNAHPPLARAAASGCTVYLRGHAQSEVVSWAFSLSGYLCMPRHRVVAGTAVPKCPWRLVRRREQVGRRMLFSTIPVAAAPSPFYTHRPARADRRQPGLLGAAGRQPRHMMRHLERAWQQVYASRRPQRPACSPAAPRLRVVFLVPTCVLGGGAVGREADEGDEGGMHEASTDHHACTWAISSTSTSVAPHQMHHAGSRGE
jgi:hypothetical protein